MRGRGKFLPRRLCFFAEADKIKEINYEEV